MSVRKTLVLTLVAAAAGIGFGAAASTSVGVETDPVAQPVQSAPSDEANRKPTDCAKPIARHDHGAERGVPTPVASGCPQPPTASSPKAKIIKGHDHAKFHKLM